jgi:hypothetical protein
MEGFKHFLLKTPHDLSLMFTDMLMDFFVLFFLFAVACHKVRVVRCSSESSQK